MVSLLWLLELNPLTRTQKQEPAVRFGARLRQGDHIFDKAIEQARSDGSLPSLLRRFLKAQPS